MRYLGIDVHSRTSVWSLVDEQGQQVGRGKTATTAPALAELVRNVARSDEVLAGQEIGTLAYFVHDAVTSAGVRILSFNAQQLRMLLSSRKKSDRRDAYWIARALQSGMHPHPVYIPPHDIRRLRSLLSQREAIVRERTRWFQRARSHLRAGGVTMTVRANGLPRALTVLLEHPDGIDAHLAEALELCQRQLGSLDSELSHVGELLEESTVDIDEVRRLMTVPGFGWLIATAIHAWVGDVTRFRNARTLCAYAGLVPTVYQSGTVNYTGHINRQGSPLLRRMLVQGAQVLVARCHKDEAAPFRAIYGRIAKRSERKKIAIVALARHLLRIAYYILRDGTVYQPELLSVPVTEGGDEAA